MGGGVGGEHVPSIRGEHGEAPPHPTFTPALHAVPSSHRTFSSNTAKHPPRGSQADVFIHQGHCLD